MLHIRKTDKPYNHITFVEHGRQTTWQIHDVTLQTMCMIIFTNFI